MFFFINDPPPPKFKTGWLVGSVSFLKETVNGLNIILFGRMQKRGIDPFKVEKPPPAVDERG
ncbi:hypothetical protein FRA28_21745 [Escherichia coli]|nr:hypothetical protein FRA28_21745 [Escherichia coli]